MSFNKRGYITTTKRGFGNESAGVVSAVAVTESLMG